jgi:hypothetical protein
LSPGPESAGFTSPAASDDEDDFGDDFDDFEEGDEDADFNDFEDGFRQPPSPLPFVRQTSLLL